MLFCDKRLIPCFRRCDIFINMPHSKNTPYNRFSSKYHRKLWFIWEPVNAGSFCFRTFNKSVYCRQKPEHSKIEFAAHLIKISSQITVYMKELVACDMHRFFFCFYKFYDFANAGCSGWHTLRRKA